jgi:ABC-2 type transport system ATP-binding protein
VADLAVQFEHVVKRFGGFTAVDGLDLEVPRGTIFGLLGPNGAGKTSSIRMLMNVFAPDEGRILVFGEPIHEDLKPRIGYLPEERGLYKKMRVREMLRFFGAIKGRDRTFLDPRIQRWGERMGLGWLGRRAEELSRHGAEGAVPRDRVPRARTVILDEPFSGLDPVNRDFLRDVVLELRKAGTTILFSTHVMEQAESLCDQIVLLYRGKPRLAGTVEEVRRREGREAAFVRVDGATCDPFAASRASSASRDAPRGRAGARAGRGQQRDRRRSSRGGGCGASRCAPSLHEIFKRVAGTLAPGPA